MNERITEMIMEFAEIAEEYSYVEYAKKQTGYSRQYFYNQKFAELIIKECADYVRSNYDSWDAEPLAFNMEKDFGLHGDYA